MVFAHRSISDGPRRGVQFLLILALAAITLLLGSTAQAAPGAALAVAATGEDTVEVACVDGEIVVTGGVSDGAGASCSTITDVTVDGVTQPRDGGAAWHAPIVIGDLTIDGALSVTGGVVRIDGNVRARSVDLLGVGGVKLSPGASISAPGGVTIDGGAVGAVLSEGSSLDAGGSPVRISGGNIIAAGAIRSDGGRVTALSSEGDFLWVTGSIDVSNASPDGVGGTVLVSRGTIVLDADGDKGASIDASGTLGGGTIHVGGEARGEGTTPTAEAVIVNTGANVIADALLSGDGGEVVIWGDQMTAYDGHISVRGGPESGDGGSVEISSKVSVEQLGTRTRTLS